jgi:hypothetical protein
LIFGRRKEDALVRYFALICDASLLLGTYILAQAQGPSNAQNNASEAAVHSYGRDAKDCLAWTDGCVSCVRQQPGADYSCSNIGIACQPKAVECRRLAAEPAKCFLERNRLTLNRWALQLFGRA